MSKIVIPMKSERRGESPVFSIRIEREYRKKLTLLEQAGVKVPELMRLVFYKQIDRALKEMSLI